MYSSVLKTLTRTPWRWPLIPFAVVALCCIFAATLVYDLAVGAVFVLSLCALMFIAVVTELFDPNLHRNWRDRFSRKLGEVVALFARHPRSVATWRNPRWWVALPLWAVTLPFIVSWALLGMVCECIAKAVRTADEKLGELTDFALWQHMRKLWGWVFEGKA